MFITKFRGSAVKQKNLEYIYTNVVLAIQYALFKVQFNREKKVFY